MYKLIIPWDDFKKAAFKTLKEKQPNILEDTAEFNIDDHYGLRNIAELPIIVIVELKD